APGVVALAGIPTIGSVLVGAWPTGLHAWADFLVTELAKAGFQAEKEVDIALVDGKPRVGGSTRHALARGEPLETACLHGDVVDAGRASGIRTPVNDALIR